MIGRNLFADKNWRKNNFAEPEDFVYEWIDETQKLLAGYGTDSIYSALSEVIESEPNRDNEQYQNFIKNSFKPFMTMHLIWSIIAYCIQNLSCLRRKIHTMQ